MSRFLRRRGIPERPKDYDDYDKWNDYFVKFVDILSKHYDKVIKNERNFTLVHYDDIWKIAEYWQAKKPRWVKVVSTRYPEDAFDNILEYSTFSSNGELRQLWMMFLSFGFHPKEGPTARQIEEERIMPKGIPEDTPLLSESDAFRYPSGIINPSMRDDILYVWRAIKLATDISLYRKKMGQKLGDLSTTITYHTGVNVAATYDAMLPYVLFSRDTPGMPKDLRNMFSSVMPSGSGRDPHSSIESVSEEVQHEDDRVQKAVDTAIAIERTAAQKEIEEYKKSLNEMTRQLDEQNNELRMAKVTTAQLATKVSDLVARLRECEEEAKKRGDVEAEREAEENREQATRVYSDITTLASTVGRATEDNTKAIRASEGVEERGSNVAQETKLNLLEQIRQGYTLKKIKAKTPEEKREAEDDTTLAGVLQRAIGTRRGSFETPAPPAPTPGYSEWTNAPISVEERHALTDFYISGERGRRGPIEYYKVHQDCIGLSY